MTKALLCLALVACGPSSQQKALTTSLLTVQVAAVGWSSFDKQHWDEIGKTCIATGPAADCAAKNAAFVKQEADVNKAFAAASAAIVVAYKLENDKTIAGAEAAVVAFVKILTDLGVKGL